MRVLYYLLHQVDCPIGSYADDMILRESTWNTLIWEKWGWNFTLYIIFPVSPNKLLQKTLTLNILSSTPTIEQEPLSTTTRTAAELDLQIQKGAEHKPQKKHPKQSSLFNSHIQLRKQKRKVDSLHLILELKRYLVLYDFKR